MKKIMSFLLITCFSVILIACSSDENTNSEQDSATEDTAPKYVSILGASDGGTFFLLANGMANLFNKELSDSKFTAQTTSGTNDILKKLNEEDGEIGFAQASMAEAAVKGEGFFEDNPQDNITGVSYMYPNVMHVIVNKKAHINTLEDLKGKKVGVGEPGGGVEVDSQRLMQALELDIESDIKPEHVTGAQGSDMLRNNQLDALIMPGGIGASNTTEILSSKNYEILPVSEEVVNKLIDINGAYFKIDIPANAYPNQEESIATYAEANWLYAREDLSEDFVYDILKTLYDNQEEMIGVHDSMENLTFDNSQNGNMVELHPGAVKFFEENDVDLE